MHPFGDRIRTRKNFRFNITTTDVVRIFRSGEPTMLNGLKRRIRLCFEVEIKKSEQLKYVRKQFST